MNEGKFQDALRELIDFQDIGEPDENGDAIGIGGITTFEERGVLTNNKGLTVSLSDGSEFQITIVRRCPPEAGECPECEEAPPASAANPYCAGCIAKFEAEEVKASG